MSIFSSDGQFTYDKEPDICPVCNHGIHPTLIKASRVSDKGNYHHAQIVFKCPISNCNSFFIAYYATPMRIRAKGVKYYGEMVFYLIGLKPVTYKGKEFSEEIEKLSQKYCKIYNEAKQAEENGLTEICGAGFRRALEFLVKDYVINKLNLDIEENKKEIEKVKMMFLKSCIETYIDNVDIKKLAERAAWLGNDETHYYRKWDDLELADLKKLVNLTETFIYFQLQKDGYLEKM